MNPGRLKVPKLSSKNVKTLKLFMLRYYIIAFINNIYRFQENTSKMKFPEKIRHFVYKCYWYSKVFGNKI